MKKEKVLKLGVIGSGGMMRSHLKKLFNRNDALVTAITEPDAEQVKATLDAFPQLSQAPIYKNYKDMLKKEKLDGVMIASPHTLHFEQIIDSLKAGLNVMVEKPMVCTIEHAKKVIQQQKKSKKIVIVAYQRKYQAVFKYMKEVIKSGQLGELTSFASLQCQNWWHPGKTWWRVDPKLSGGGQLNDSGSHLVDILLWMLDLVPKKVYACISNRGAKVDINSTLTIECKDGIQGNLTVIGEAPKWLEEITIWGNKGAIFYREGKATVHINGKEPVTQEMLPHGSTPIENFINSILKKENPVSLPESGLRVIELTESAWKSAKTKLPVKVPYSKLKGK